MGGSQVCPSQRTNVAAYLFINVRRTRAQIIKQVLWENAKTKIRPSPYPPPTSPSSLPSAEGGCYVEVRGAPEQDISSLCAFGLGARQVLGIARVSARAFLWITDTPPLPPPHPTPACGGASPPHTHHRWLRGFWGVRGGVVYVYIYI